METQLQKNYLKIINLTIQQIKAHLRFFEQFQQEIYQFFRDIQHHQK